MDETRFDAMIRVLGSGAPRRRVLAGLLASVPLALGGREAAAKKCKKGKKKCGNKCIPKSNCCTSAACGPNETCKKGQCRCAPNCTNKDCGDNGCGGVCGSCTGNDTCSTNGQCVCEPNCGGKECGADGCGDVCGTCDQGDTCTPQGQCCTPDCEGKSPCASDGCGGTCGTCQNGTCQGGQCVCRFPDTGATCSPGICCAQEQACVGGACGACPEAPDPCLPAQEHFCGRTSAPSPFCFCVTSVDDDTTCSSVFVNQSQSVSCDSDADCTGILGFGVDTVCVHAPCLGLGIDKVCMNKGCVNLNAPRTSARADRNAPKIRQANLRARH